MSFFDEIPFLLSDMVDMVLSNLGESSGTDKTSFESVAAKEVVVSNPLFNSQEEDETKSGHASPDQTDQSDEESMAEENTDHSNLLSSGEKDEEMDVDQASADQSDGESMAENNTDNPNLVSDGQEDEERNENRPDSECSDDETEQIRDSVKASLHVRGHFVLKKTVLFAGVPKTGSLFHRLPSDDKIGTKIIKSCSLRLQNIIKKAPCASLVYDSKITKEFAKAVWNATGKYFVNISKCELPYWLGPLVRGNPAFTKPGERSGQKVEEKICNFFSNSKERKQAIKELEVKYVHLVYKKNNYWPATQEIIQEIYTNLWKLGCPTHEKAVDYAPQIHFRWPTYTHHKM